LIAVPSGIDPNAASVTPGATLTDSPPRNPAPASASAPTIAAAVLTTSA
jgi:hypothetical protein